MRTKPRATVRSARRPTDGLSLATLPVCSSDCRGFRRVNCTTVAILGLPSPVTLSGGKLNCRGISPSKSPAGSMLEISLVSLPVCKRDRRGSTSSECSVGAMVGDSCCSVQRCANSTAVSSGQASGRPARQKRCRRRFRHAASFAQALSQLMGLQPQYRVRCNPLELNHCLCAQDRV